MWTILWIVAGIVAFVFLMVISMKFFGRGHLGAKQSESHYLDEVETRSRFPWT